MDEYSDESEESDEDDDDNEGSTSKRPSTGVRVMRSKYKS